jgi:hypothetical protein
VAPELKTSISFVAGVFLEGVQFDAVAQFPPAALFHVYVVCEKVFSQIIRNEKIKKTNPVFIKFTKGIKITKQKSNQRKLDGYGFLKGYRRIL